MKKGLLIPIICLISTTAFADAVPKGIQTRYETLKKTIVALDFKAFSDFFAPNFVNINPDGKSTSRAELLGEIKQMFAGSTKAEPVEKLFSSTTKNGVIDVKFDLLLKLTGKDGVTVLHEVGTDSWKLVNHKWLMIKTVETKFSVKMPPKVKKSKID